MWRFQRKSLPALYQVHPSKTFCRFRHQGLSKLDSLAAEIMSGNNPTELGQQAQPDYSTWSTTSLIERISELERQLHTRTAEYTSPSQSSGPANALAQEIAPDTLAPNPQPQQGQQPQNEIPRWLATGKFDPNDITHAPGARLPKKQRKMDPAKYNFRFIALKFAYLGQRYNGLEHANGNVTPLPTIEEEMWKALRKQG